MLWRAPRSTTPATAEFATTGARHPQEHWYSRTTKMPPCLLTGRSARVASQAEERYRSEASGRAEKAAHYTQRFALLQQRDSFLQRTCKPGLFMVYGGSDCGASKSLPPAPSGMQRAVLHRC